MHEVSIANSIIETVQNLLPENSNEYVSSVQIKVGELSSIEIDALQFSFDIIKAKTPLNKAELKIEIIEGKAQCSDCNEVFPMHGFATPCPNCNSYLVKILQGKEMKIVSFEMEENSINNG